MVTHRHVGGLYLAMKFIHVQSKQIFERFFEHLERTPEGVRAPRGVAIDTRKLMEGLH